MSKNSHRELRKLCRPKRREVTVGWTNCSNEELLELNSTPYIIKVVKYRGTGRAGHVAHIGKKIKK